MLIGMCRWTWIKAIAVFVVVTSISMVFAVPSYGIVSDGCTQADEFIGPIMDIDNSRSVADCRDAEDESVSSYQDSGSDEGEILEVTDYQLYEDGTLILKNERSSVAGHGKIVEENSIDYYYQNKVMLRQLTKRIIIADVYETDCVGVFEGFSQCEEIYGLEKIKPIKSNHEWLGEHSDLTSMFAGCSKLRSVDLSSLDRSVNYCPEAMFSGCSSLESINLSGFNFVESAAAMFLDCSSLCSVALDSGGFNVNNSECIFSGCGALADLRLPEGASVSGDLVFASCSSLQSLDLSHCGSVELGDFAFSGCGALADLRLPEGARISGGYVFEGCKSMRSVGPVVVDTENCGSVFSGQESLEEVEVVLSSDTAGDSASQLFAGNITIKSVKLGVIEPDIPLNVSEMFLGCSSLRSVEFFDDYPLSATAMRRMFAECVSLESVNFVGMNSSGVTSFEGMFEGCTSLGSVDLSALDASRVTTLEKMFSGCSSLRELKLQGIDLGNVENASYLFENCTSLDNAYYSELCSAANRYCSDSYMYRGCTSLVAVDLSEFYDPSAEFCYIVGAHMFEGCTSLKSVIPPRVTWRADTGAFKDCVSLEYIDLTDFYEREAFPGYEPGTGLASFMFSGCVRLKQIKVGEGWCTNSYFDVVFPTPDSNYIPGATGYWVNELGWAYPPDGIPSRRAGTYTVQVEGDSPDVPDNPGDDACEHHVWKESDSLVRPSCVDGGEVIYVCESCGKTRTEQIAALGHDFSIEGGDAVAATCTEDGHAESFRCSRCQEVREGEVVSALGHDWGQPAWNWRTNHAAATARFVCSRDASHAESEKAIVFVQDVEGGRICTASVKHDGKDYSDMMLVPRSGSLVVKGDPVLDGFRATLNPVASKQGAELRVSRVTSGSAHDALIGKIAQSPAASSAGAFKVTLYLDGVETHKDFGSLALSFPVDAANNGKNATVYHCHGDDAGNITSHKAVVKDGVVVMENVTDLSTFAIEIPADDTQQGGGINSGTNGVDSQQPGVGSGSDTIPITTVGTVPTTTVGAQLAKTGDETPAAAIAVVGLLFVAVATPAIATMRKRRGRVSDESA